MIENFCGASPQTTTPPEHAFREVPLLSLAAAAGGGHRRRGGRAVRLVLRVSRKISSLLALCTRRKDKDDMKYAQKGISLGHTRLESTGAVDADAWRQQVTRGLSVRGGTMGSLEFTEPLLVMQVPDRVGPTPPFLARNSAAAEVVTETSWVDRNDDQCQIVKEAQAEGASAAREFKDPTEDKSSRTAHDPSIGDFSSSSTAASAASVVAAAAKAARKSLTLLPGSEGGCQPSDSEQHQTEGGPQDVRAPLFANLAASAAATAVAEAAKAARSSILQQNSRTSGQTSAAVAATTSVAGATARQGLVIESLVVLPSGPFAKAATALSSGPSEQKQHEWKAHGHKHCPQSHDNQLWQKTDDSETQEQGQNQLVSSLQHSHQQPLQKAQPTQQAEMRKLLQQDKDMQQQAFQQLQQPQPLQRHLSKHQRDEHQLHLQQQVQRPSHQDFPVGASDLIEQQRESSAAQLERENAPHRQTRQWQQQLQAYPTPLRLQQQCAERQTPLRQFSPPHKAQHQEQQQHSSCTVAAKKMSSLEAAAAALQAAAASTAAAAAAEQAEKGDYTTAGADAQDAAENPVCLRRLLKELRLWQHQVISRVPQKAAEPQRRLGKSSTRSSCKRRGSSAPTPNGLSVFSCVDRPLTSPGVECSAADAAPPAAVANAPDDFIKARERMAAEAAPPSLQPRAPAEVLPAKGNMTAQMAAAAPSSEASALLSEQNTKGPPPAGWEQDPQYVRIVGKASAEVLDVTGTMDAAERHLKMGMDQVSASCSTPDIEEQAVLAGFAAWQQKQQRAQRVECTGSIFPWVGRHSRERMSSALFCSSNRSTSNLEGVFRQQKQPPCGSKNNGRRLRPWTCASGRSFASAPLPQQQTQQVLKELEEQEQQCTVQGNYLGAFRFQQQRREQLLKRLLQDGKTAERKEALHKVAQANCWAAALHLNKKYKAVSFGAKYLICHVTTTNNLPIKKIPMQVFLSYEYPRLFQRYRVMFPGIGTAPPSVTNPIPIPLIGVIGLKHKLIGAQVHGRVLLWLVLSILPQHRTRGSLTPEEVNKREAELQDTLLATLQLTNTIREQLEIVKSKSRRPLLQHLVHHGCLPPSSLHDKKPWELLLPVLKEFGVLQPCHAAGLMSGCLHAWIQVLEALDPLVKSTFRRSRSNSSTGKEGESRTIGKGNDEEAAQNCLQRQHQQLAMQTPSSDQGESTGRSESNTRALTSASNTTSSNSSTVASSCSASSAQVEKHCTMSVPSIDQHSGAVTEQQPQAVVGDQKEAFYGFQQSTCPPRRDLREASPPPGPLYSVAESLRGGKSRPHLLLFPDQQRQQQKEAHHPHQRQQQDRSSSGDAVPASRGTLQLQTSGPPQQGLQAAQQTLRLSQQEEQRKQQAPHFLSTQERQRLQSLRVGEQQAEKSFQHHQQRQLEYVAATTPHPQKPDEAQPQLQHGRHQHWQSELQQQQQRIPGSLSGRVQGEPTLTPPPRSHLSPTQTWHLEAGPFCADAKRQFRVLDVNQGVSSTLLQNHQKSQQEHRQHPTPLQQQQQLVHLQQSRDHEQLLPGCRAAAKVVQGRSVPLRNQRQLHAEPQQRQQQKHVQQQYSQQKVHLTHQQNEQQQNAWLPLIQQGRQVTQIAEHAQGKSAREVQHHSEQNLNLQQQSQQISQEEQQQQQHTQATEKSQQQDSQQSQVPQEHPEERQRAQHQEAERKPQLHSARQKMTLQGRPHALPDCQGEQQQTLPPHIQLQHVPQQELSQQQLHAQQCTQELPMSPQCEGQQQRIHRSHQLQQQQQQVESEMHHQGWQERQPQEQHVPQRREHRQQQEQRELPPQLLALRRAYHLRQQQKMLAPTTPVLQQQQEPSYSEQLSPQDLTPPMQRTFPQEQWGLQEGQPLNSQEMVTQQRRLAEGAVPPCPFCAILLKDSEDAVARNKKELARLEEALIQWMMYERRTLLRHQKQNERLGWLLLQIEEAAWQMEDGPARDHLLDILSERFSPETPSAGADDDAAPREQQHCQLLRANSV
ncbi:hypothetical protein cyc_08063 [Cyclospora cayetanensis]|uniref:Uncharacterized protein n=1 Tax=Cyclospora cayetanensis TaxID=88456 RepID=A0A1D3D414_9EIME|nr:hypothetical protein cyc_08063 [Cyclospora cayetanensis]